MQFTSFLKRRVTRTAAGLALVLAVILTSAALVYANTPAEPGDGGGGEVVLPVEPDGGIGGEVILPVEPDGGIGN